MLVHDTIWNFFLSWILKKKMKWFLIRFTIWNYSHRTWLQKCKVRDILSEILLFFQKFYFCWNRNSFILMEILLFWRKFFYSDGNSFILTEILLFWWKFHCLGRNSIILGRNYIILAEILFFWQKNFIILAEKFHY